MLDLEKTHPHRDSLLGPIVSFLAAAQFLTVVPPLVRRPFTSQELGSAVGFFPLVGLLLGGLLAGASLLITPFLPPGIPVVLVLVLWIVLTGALHWDGFLDSCDGLFGGRSPEKRLEIMRDERVGAYALAGGVLLLLMKFFALQASSPAIIPLWLAPVFGRWAMSLALVFFPYGRSAGLGRVMKDHASWQQAVLATAITSVAAWLAFGWLALLALLAAAAIMLGIAFFALSRLPGLTGDVYGAICELVETLALLLLVTLALP